MTSVCRLTALSIGVQQYSSGAPGKSPSKKAGLFTGHDPARGSGQEGETRGSSRVGSDQGVIETARVSSGRFRRFSSLTGRVRSPGSDPTREK